MISCSRRTWYIIIGVVTLVVAVIIIAVVLAVVIPKTKDKDKPKKEELGNSKHFVDKKSFYISENKNRSSNDSNYMPRGFDSFQKGVFDILFPDLSVDMSEVTYDLYTQKNKINCTLITNNNVSVLANSYFDPQKRSVFVVHGWTKSRNGPVNLNLRPAIIEHHDVNLFIVDWAKPASAPYETAHRYVKSVGKIIGDFINTIQSTYNLTGASFILIGHSLGAQVAGNAGAEVKRKVKHIVGLDPAGPLFTYARTDNRLDPSDGLFVQVIHTDGGRFGFYDSIGHVDYYPNGGVHQPGCSIFDLKGKCSHARAFLYYAESLARGPVFRAYRCSNWPNYKDRNTRSLETCDNKKESFMGQLEHNTSITGDFYLKTNAESPYAKDEPLFP